jgi:hypothetical protein
MVTWQVGGMGLDLQVHTPGDTPVISPLTQSLHEHHHLL